MVQKVSVFGMPCCNVRIVIHKPISNAALWITSSPPRMKSRNSSATDRGRLVDQEIVADAVYAVGFRIHQPIRLDVNVNCARSGGG